MKIIIAPAKTLNLNSSCVLPQTERLYTKTTDSIINHLSKYSKSLVSKRLKVKGDLLENTYNYIQTFNSSKALQAITTYNGFVYKKLDINNYSLHELDYLNGHLIILDALYGMLRPSDMIMPYRLDFTMPIKLDLYNKWRNLKIDDDLIINLASNEFSKLIKQPMITITFKEERDGKFKLINTYSKMARGAFLHYCIKNQIKMCEDLKNFSKEGYTFNETLSNASNYIFTRNQQIG